jgi:hypothetical protein
MPDISTSFVSEVLERNGGDAADFFAREGLFVLLSMMGDGAIKSAAVIASFLNCVVNRTR